MAAALHTAHGTLGAAQRVSNRSLAPMKIGIDAHTVGNQRSGDESYTIGLVRGLASIDDRNLYTLYTTSERASEILGPLPENFRLQRVRPHQRHTRILFSLPLQLAREPQDVVHFQYIAPPHTGASLVLTVHDVSFEVFPEYFAPMERVALRWGTRLNMRRADKVITVSEFSKGQLTSMYGLAPAKIAVTHNAVGEEFAKPHDASRGRDTLRRLGVERDYILWVGNFIRRKRPEVVVEAFQRLLDEADPGCDLVLAGGKAGRYPELLATVKRAGLEQRVHFAGYVGASDLADLYRHAQVFVFPSQYEGFGIPVLEAMSCGTPVVCSGESSLGEVAGDAAVVLSHVAADSLANALRDVLGDTARRAELSRRGLERARRFSWDETARATLAVYEDAFLMGVGRTSDGRY